MIVAFWAAVGKVALKVLQFLVGDKKGRKFLGYVIGIALFIVLLPVIAIYGLFGWLSGGEVAEIVGYDAVYQNLPTEIREQIDENRINAVVNAVRRRLHNLEQIIRERQSEIFVHSYSSTEDDVEENVAEDYSPKMEL